MAKQIFKIDQFHGGLNNNADPRDIADNELSEATDIMVDELGKIRMMGGLATSVTSNAAGISEGRGLFYFSHDRQDAQDGQPAASISGAGESSDGDDYLVLCDSGGTGHDIYSKDETTWGVGKITGNMTIPTYVIVDGALRISDGNFDLGEGAGRYNKWYGYIQRFNFPGIDLGDLYNGSSNKDGHKYNQWWDEVSYLVVPSASEIAVDTAITNSEINTETLSLQVGKQPLGATVISACETTNGWGFTNDGGGGESLTVVANTAVESQGTYCIALQNNTTYTVDSNTPISLNFDFSAGSPAASHFDFTDKSIYFSLYMTSVSVQNDIDYLEVRVRSSGSNYAVYRVETDDLKAGITTDNWNETIELAEGKHDSLGGTFDKTSITEIDFMFHLVSGEELNFGSATASNIPNIALDNIYHTVQGLSSSIGNWDGEYRFYYSFIYDEKQESLLTEFTGNDFESDNMMSAYLTVFYHKNTSADSPRPRRTGANIYTSKITTDGTGVEDDRYLILECDFVKGVKIAGTSAYTPWVDDDALTAETVKSTSELTSNIKGFETYESLNGYSPSVSTNAYVQGAGFKTAVVANRMLYTANVCYGPGDDKKIASDGMFKSPVDRFDVVVPDRLIEVAVNDGDEIIKLETYADRLLQFKKRKMYLINISQELEFLEDTFNHKGVLHYGATCLTDYGIAWVNRFGCYLYDGKSVSNLLEKQGRQIIKESKWESFTTDKSIIGYIPKKRQLIVLKDCSASSAGDIYLYDMVTRSWVEGNSKFTDSQIQSNFINDWNGDLVHANTSTTGNIVKWADDLANATTATSSTVSFNTKDLDFGQPGQRKKVYKVFVTYKSASDTNVRVRYDTNGGTDFDLDFETGDNYAEDNLQGTGSAWAIAELKPDNSSESNNIKSFQLKFYATGAVPSSFEINDISILYRLKPAK